MSFQPETAIMTETATREAIFEKKQPKKTASTEFKRSLAIVIGIDCYSNRIPPLTTAVNDASRLARILETQHGYSVTLLAEDVTKSCLEAVFKEQKNNLSENDRLLVYFAGHGVALEGDNGPAGFLIPQDATLEEKTFWPMTELHEALEALPCRHVLVILDCCFAGAFRWSSKRDFQPLPSVIHKERYERFLRSSAWQVITSAAHNQKALDVLCGHVLGEHGAAWQEQRRHSPFALALFKALYGEADLIPADEGDGIITAMELANYLQYHVSYEAEQKVGHQQMPQLWPLNKHGHGEFIFLVPGGKVNLPPAPDLTKENNPYKGLYSYEKGDSKLFFGRKSLIKKLRQVVEEQPFTAVLGASGTGKSSLVQAGLLPALENNTKEAAEQGSATQASSWFILEKEEEQNYEKKKRVMRPGANPLSVLRSLLIKELPGVRPEREEDSTAAGLIWQWRKKNQGQKLLLVIDQFEELITRCRQEQAREDFIRELMQALEEHSEVLRLVLTLRSDFEAQISQTDLKKYWQDKNRFVVPPMTQDELREVIEEPASVKVLYFEPHALIDRLINEVIQTPGALPLLSFTLSELYLRYVTRQKDVEQEEGDRALTEADYEEIGGVIGSLRRRIDQEYELLDADHQATMRRILLRMVAFEGGGLTRRRVPRWELKYPDAEENKRVDRVVAQLSQVRLIVEGSSEKAGGGLEEDVEPAHDALIVAWDKLLEWQKDEAENMLLHRQLTRAAADWEDSASAKDRNGLLWDSSPRLLRTQEILEQKWSRSKAVPTAGQKSFRGLRQFWRVLFPTFKHLEQHIWLNRVETDFVRRSVEKKRKRTWNVTGIILVVIAALVIAWRAAENQKEIAITQKNIADKKTVEAKQERDRAEEKRLESNYNLAKAFEKESLRSLEKRDIEEYKRVVLFSSEALNQDIEKYKLALEPVSIGMLFSPEVFRDPLAELWNSPETQDVVNSISFSHDGKRLISSSSMNRVVTKIVPIENNELIRLSKFRSRGWNNADADNTVMQVWDITVGKELMRLKGHSAFVTSVSYSPDDRLIASASWDKTVRLWDANTGIELKQFKGHTRGVNSVAFSPKDGRLLASASGDGVRKKEKNDNTVRLWDTETGREIKQMNGHFDRVNSVSFSSDGRLLASASDDKTIRIWDVVTGFELKKIEGHSSFVTSVSFSPDGRLLASASVDKTIKVWDVNTGSELKKIEGHSSPVTNVRFSPDGRLLASASTSDNLPGVHDETVRIWDVETGTELKRTKGVNDVAFSPDGRWIASASSDKTVRILDVGIVNGPKKIGAIEYFSAITDMDFSHDGRLLASAGNNRTVHVWDVETGKELKRMEGINTVSFHPDGQRLASALEQHNTVRILDINTEKELDRMVGGAYAQFVTSINFNSDGRLLAILGAGVIQIWDIDIGEELYRIEGSEAIFSPNDQMLAFFSPIDGTVRIWDHWRKKELRKFKVSIGANQIPTMAFSPDSKRIALANKILDTDTGQELFQLNGHSLNINNLNFSPDGKWIVSSSEDGTFTVWSAETGNKQYQFANSKISFRKATFLPDGEHIAAISSQKNIWIWNVKNFSLFLLNSKPMPRYKVFIEAVKFLWQLDVQGLEIVHKKRTQADMERFGSLLAPPPLGKSKFDQVLEWAEKQQASNPTD